MAKVVRHVPWDEFLARGDLIGATVETEEVVVGGCRGGTEGTVVDVVRSGQFVSLVVESHVSDRRYEVGGDISFMDVYELDDGSCEFDIPCLGTTRIVFCD